ncbi:MAG: helix-turn-helix domain-containing protein, partial [Chloroflexota bacterium]
MSVSDDDRAKLERLVGSGNTPQKVVLRARIVLLTADGMPTMEMAGLLGTSCPTITR